MGLFRRIEDFINLMMATSSLMILKDCKVGRAIKRFARSSLVTMSTFRCLRSFCIVFPYTELFMSLNKSFSNEDVATWRLEVLKSMYDLSQLDCSNSSIL